MPYSHSNKDIEHFHLVKLDETISGIGEVRNLHRQTIHKSSRNQQKSFYGGPILEV